MKKSKLGRVGMRIGALLLSLSLLVCTDGLDVWAIGAEAVVTEVNEGMMLSAENESIMIPEEIEIPEAGNTVEVIETEEVATEEPLDLEEPMIPEVPSVISADEDQMQILKEPYKTYKPYEDATYELEYVEIEDGIEIVRYTGTASGNLVLPDEIEGKPVKSIGTNAFRAGYSFTGNLIIPESVEHIGDYAFSECNKLEGSLVLPKNLKTIGDRAFYRCIRLTGSLIIPETIESMGEYAFYDCTGFDGDLEIYVENIEVGVFCGASGFKSLKLHEGVKKIGRSAFSCGTGFTGNLIIPESVESIGERAFFCCAGFTGSLILPENVEDIGNNAFADCAGFTGSLIIPPSVKSIGYDAFIGCTGFDGDLEVYGGTIGAEAFNGDRGFKSLKLHEGVTKIGRKAFVGCEGFKGDLIIPESVTDIGYGAFSNLRNVTGILRIKSDLLSVESSIFSQGGFSEIVIEEGVTCLPGSIFYGCSNVKKISLPNSLTAIKCGAFQECYGLRSIIIPEEVKSIEEYAFYRCTQLEEIIIPDSVTSIGEAAFAGSGLKGIKLSKGITKIENSLFEYCRNLQEIKLPAGITSIGESAFYSCESLSGVLEIPEGVTSIGAWAFQSCEKLEEIIIPDSVTSIGEAAFVCSGLKRIKLSKGITKIENSLFNSCQKLTEVELPNGITSIGDCAFIGCSELSEIIIPNGVTSIGSEAFAEGGLKKITLPKGINIIGYRAFAGSGLIEVELPIGLTSVEEELFVDCRELTKVIIPMGVTCIKYRAFSLCDKLEEVIIPDSVISIEREAFESCYELKEVIIPNSVTSIGERAFWNSGLKRIELSEGMTKIENSLFEYCGYLQEIKLPAGITSIGESAFYSCESLSGVLEIPEGVTSIGANAFGYCSGLNGKIRIPSSVTSIDESAFYGIRSAEEASDIIIYGKKGSYAETFAKEMGYGFVVDEGGEIGKYPLPDKIEVESAISLGECWVIVLDNYGKAVTDADITVELVKNGEAITYVYEEGIIKIPLDNTNWFNEIEICAKKSGMMDASGIYRVMRGGNNYLKMRKESIEPYIESVMVDGMQNMYANVTCFEYVVYKKDANRGKLDVFRVVTSGDKPTKYEMVQGDRVIATSDTNLLSVNLAKELEVSGPWPVIRIYDSGNRIISQKQVLLMATEMDKELIELTQPKITMGSVFSFPIGDIGIPILSESEFEINTLVDSPVMIEQEGSIIRIAIGDNNLLEKEKDPLSNLEELIEDFNNERVKALLSDGLETGFIGGFETEIGVFGYGEGKIDDKTKEFRVDVGIWITFTSENDYTRYYFVGPIPCYGKVVVGVEGEGFIKAPIAWNDGSLVLPPFDIDSEVELTMGVGGGVGLNDAVCIDGTVNVTGTWIHNSDRTIQSSQASMHPNVVTVHGSGQLRAVLLMFEWSSECTTKKLQLYPKVQVLGADESIIDMNILNATDYRILGRDYLLDDGTIPVLKSNGDDINVLINGLYPDAKPRLVSYKGTDYLFYLDDQADRGAEDRTALVYRKEVNGVFGEPVIIEDDKTGDFDYDVKACEDGIYVLWQDGNKSLQGITTLEEASEALTLSAAKVTEQGVTLLDSPAVTEGLAPISPILVDTGKEIKACWYENSSNDLLQSGQGTSRFYGQAVGAKDDKQKIGETVRTITTTDFGMYENALSVAYTVDEDNDISTVEDREIYVASKGTSRRLTDNAVTDSNAQFGTVSGKQVLVYYSDKNLACTDGKTTELLLDEEDSYVTNGLISDDFQFVSESANPAIVWKDAYWMGEEAGQGMTMIRFKDGSWGKPVRVAGTTDSLVAYDVLEKNADTLRVVYTAKGEEAGKEITRLYETEGRERASVGLVRIAYEQEDYVPGENLPFSVTLQNTGALNAEEYEITISNKNGETIFTQKGSEAIPVGEEKVITLANFSPADTGDLQTLRIQVNGDGRKQDAMDFTLGGADLSLRTDISYDEDDRILNLQMINDTNMTENMKFTITGAENEVLYEKEYEAVPGKSSVNYLCKLDKFFDMTEADSINLKLESMGRTETYLFDNETTLYRPGSVTKITEVTLEQKEMELTSGDTAQLKVTTDGEGTVLYESNNPDCVSVSESGVITAKAPGSATVSAYTEDGGRAICIITVKEAAPSKPTIVLGDVEESSWQYRYVKYACENDYMKGKKTDEAGRILFDPEGTLTRAEFVQVLYNAEGKPAVTYKNRFSDVPENQWYTNAIIWATEKGIVNGYGNGKYGVSDSITREQLATMLNKYAQYKGYKVDATAELNTYTDTSKISGWAVNYMKWIVGSNIMSGKGDRLDPQGNATRAECATLVNKFHISYGE